MSPLSVAELRQASADAERAPCPPGRGPESELPEWRKAAMLGGFCHSRPEIAEKYNCKYNALYGWFSAPEKKWGIGEAAALVTRVVDEVLPTMDVEVRMLETNNECPKTSHYFYVKTRDSHKKGVLLRQRMEKRGYECDAQVFHGVFSFTL
eukprot:g20443.t1